MRLFLALSVTAAIATGSAARADFCQHIRALDGQSRDITLVLPTTGTSAKCTRSLVLSGGSQVHCGWAFAYRASEATLAFQYLVSTVSACPGAAAHVTADLDVNHPDFYDLQTFRLGGQEIGVSLKDKAALSETYVFLRVAVPD